MGYVLETIGKLRSHLTTSTFSIDYVRNSSELAFQEEIHILCLDTQTHTKSRNAQSLKQKVSPYTLPIPNVSMAQVGEAILLSSAQSSTTWFYCYIHLLPRCIL